MGSSLSCWFRLVPYTVARYQFGQRPHSFSGGYFVRHMHFYPYPCDFFVLPSPNKPPAQQATTARTLHVTCTLEFSEATKTGLRFLKSLDTTMVMYIWFNSDFWRVRRKNDRWDERFISRKATCKRPTIAFACTRLKVWLMKTSGSFYILGRVLDLGIVLSLRATVVLRLNKLSISECVETSKTAAIIASS